MHSISANGAEIPALGLGTWTLKGAKCTEMVAEALEIGYRHVDTASAYDNEEAVGAGIRTSGVPRGAVFLTTKVWHADLAPRDFRRSAEASLKRLGTGYLDLLLIHWPSQRVPLADTIGALNEARAAGLTRHIGVSNFPTELLAEAIRLSDAPLVADQVEYHPYLDQSKVHAACRAAGMAMVSYCPLHRGGELLSEKPVLDAAKAHGRTSGQIVLRWHVQQEGVVAIPRTTKNERLKENIDIFDFSLSDAEMAAISALSRAGSRLCSFGFSPAWDE
ncbi:MAG: 2,5-didehydrogluconate reductase [Rhizobiales bacterium 65-79]|jgi:diketogulonate reductase-like aldo/keto reductase|nr:aldo/keto reductase [Hyphomicrobiales bacterium]OJT99961.1 MAG: 2,5-didehydrogluconate reductase [Rhizobiales bacterium 65-79]